ncbi:glycosyltransferase [Methylobacterium sp. JK268]
MQPKPKLTFFVPGLSVGGAERHTLDLRSRLESLGYPTSLLVYGSARSEHVLTWPGARDAVMLGCGGAFSPRSWHRVGQALARENPDILFAINPTPIVSAIPFSWGLRAKVVGILHSTVPRRGEGARTALFMAAARFLDTLVYVSENQRTYWRKRGLRARRDVAIVNGIDLTRFSPRPSGREEVRRAWGMAPTDFVMGLLGAMRPEKNHRQLIDALVGLRQAGIPAKVVLVGDGPERDAITRYVAQTEMSPHVLFVGEQSDVRLAIAGLDVGVLCSSTETLSLSALEILASGVPVVLSDVGGSPEIVQDGVNGYLFEVGRTDQLVSRLARVAEPGERRRLAAAAQTSATRFDIHRMVDGYDALIGELVRPGP